MQSEDIKGLRKETNQICILQSSICMRWGQWIGGGLVSRLVAGNWSEGCDEDRG